MSFRKKWGFFFNNPKETQLLTRLRLGLSHLREHKFKHNFQDTFISIYNCGEGIENSYQLPSSLFTLYK